MQSKDELKSKRSQLERELNIINDKIKIIEKAENDNIDISKYSNKYFKTKDDGISTEYYYVEYVNGYDNTLGDNIIKAIGYSIHKMMAMKSFSYKYRWGVIIISPDTIEEITKDDWVIELKDMAKSLNRKIKEYEKGDE